MKKTNISDRIIKYQEKITKLLRALDRKVENHQILHAVKGFSNISPMDCRVYYWLIKNNFILRDIQGYKTITYVNSSDVKKLYNYLTKYKPRYKKKPRVIEKEGPITKAAFNFKAPSVDHLNAIKEQIKNTNKKGTSYDLVLNVKLVVTEIEFKQ